MIRLMELQCGEIGVACRSLEDARASAVEAPPPARDLVPRDDWPRERVPDARLPDVEGLVALLERGAVESHDWSLTSGCYVGLAPEEEGFDFEEAFRSFQIGSKGLNEQAEKFAERIARSYEGSEA